MPPVFGPAVAVADPLVVLRRRHRHGALAVAEREQRQLLALEELLEHHRVSPKRRSTKKLVDRVARLGLVSADDHALARRQHVRLQHGGIGGAGERAPSASSRSGRPRTTPWARRPRASAPWRTPWSPRCAPPPPSARTRGCPRPPARPRAPPPAAPRVRPPRGRSPPRARAATRPSRRRRRRRGRAPCRARSPRCPARRASRAAAGCASSARTIACSRPPPPTTSTRTGWS